MKTTIYSVLALALFLVLPMLANAQPVAGAEATKLNEYLDNPFAEETRDAAWWKELETELIPTGENAARDIQVSSLQNIIFFAQNYGDKINLERSADLLYDIYAGHSDDGVRIMALVGLHSTNSEKQLFKVVKGLQHENSERVRAHTVHVLHDYFNERYPKGHPAFMYVSLYTN